MLNELAVGALLRLATTERTDDGRLPPVNSVMERASAVGTVFAATSEYRDWFDRTYPPTSGDHRRAGKVPLPSLDLDRGKETRSSDGGDLEVPDF